MDFRQMEIDAIRADVTPYVEKLKNFHTADEVRDFLLAEEIMARQCQATGCALAEYLKGSGHVVGVSQNHIYAFVDGCAGKPVPLWPVIGDNTAAMSQFVYNFDDGYYPELVAG
jgi:hypothetical protein